MILDLIKEVKSLFTPDKVAIDNITFQLHCKVTVVLLVTLSTIVACSEYFGSPIECFCDSKSIPESLVNIFCWISTTYSLPDLWNATVGTEVVYPGIGNSYYEPSKVYHSYYQWVVFVLYIQAMTFAAPKYFWSVSENGKTANLSDNLKFKILPEKVRNLKLVKLAEYLELSKGTHGQHFYFFSLMEILNLANVVLQMVLLNIFLNGKFFSLGTNFITWLQEDEFDSNSQLDYGLNVQVDPLLEVFPRMTKCTFHNFGPSGDVEKHDAFCLLTINHVNEKVFLIIWFWYHFLTTFTSISIICSILTICSKDIRIIVLQRECQLLPRYLAEKVVKTRSVTDWFLLKQLAQNVDEGNFKNLCQLLLKESSAVQFEDEDEKRCYKQCQPEEFELNQLNS